MKGRGLVDQAAFVTCRGDGSEKLGQFRCSVVCGPRVVRAGWRGGGRGRREGRGGDGESGGERDTRTLN